MFKYLSNIVLIIIYSKKLITKFRLLIFSIDFKPYTLLASIILNSRAIVYLVNNKALIKSNFFIKTNREIVKVGS